MAETSTAVRGLATIAASGLLAACSGTPTPPPTPPSGPSSHASTPSAPATVAPSSSSPAVPSNTAGPTATPTPSRATSTIAGSAAPAACTGPQLAVTRGLVQGAAGRRITTLVFTDTSATSCDLQGYPGVAGVDAAGRQLARATRNPGPEPTVTLDPGGTATAQLAAANIEGAGQCPTRGTGILVTPPNTTRSTLLPGDMPLCSPFTIDPVTAPQ